MHLCRRVDADPMLSDWFVHNSILQWRDPAVSQSFLLVLAALVLVIMFVPVRIALIAGGGCNVVRMF